MQKFLSENLYPANGGIAPRNTHAVGGVLSVIITHKLS